MLFRSYIVSEVSVSFTDEIPEGALCEDGSAIAVAVEVAEGEKCDRCWMYTKDGIHDGEGVLCPRCAAIVK